MIIVKGFGEFSGVRGEYYYDKETKTFKPVSERSDKKEKKKKKVLIQTDEIEPTVSHASFEGKIFTSKSALRRHYKENGYIETGGSHHIDTMERRQTAKEREEEIRREREEFEKAYYDIKYNNVEFTEQEKEIFKREEEKWKEKYKIKPIV